MKYKEGAQLLGIHPKSFSRLMRRYKCYGESVLMPAKPGPKKFTPDNRTPEWIEDLLVELEKNNPDMGPQPLAEKLEEVHGIKLHTTTIWRILKRRKIRYTRDYKRFKLDPKLYCLDRPGEEIQLDGSYPYGRSRKVVSFDAVDDCSRFLCARLYNRETAANAIEFVKYLIQKFPFRV